MVIRVRYTRNGTRYADYSKATPLEELELYKQMLPKNGSVIYRPHDVRGLHRTSATNPATSSGSSPASAAAAPAAAAERADPPLGKAPRPR